MKQTICGTDELADLQCREFEFLQGDEAVKGFICRQGEIIQAFRNHCPHTGAPLNWMPNEFFNYEQDFIQCAIHGALFRLHDGLCVHGPCQGQSLLPLPVSVETGLVCVTIE